LPCLAFRRQGNRADAYGRSWHAFRRFVSVDHRAKPKTLLIICTANNDFVARLLWTRSHRRRWYRSRLPRHIPRTGSSLHRDRSHPPHQRHLVGMGSSSIAATL
jgi:hypothetical protein